LNLVVAAGLSIPMAAAAASAAAPPQIDCKTAQPRPKGVDFKTYAAFCDAQAAAERTKLGAPSTGFAAAAGTIQQNLKTPDTLSFANVPVWSDADIAAQFAATRDRRYMTTASNPGFQRRISWMYPNDGCFARAEQVDVLVAQAGKTRPYKLFAMGDLRVYTSNSPTGMVTWGWHTVPVVKNTAGQVIVMDAALSPCRPLPWKEWLGLMVNSLSELNDPINGYGVGLGDSNAYFPSSLVSGEPSHSAESLNDQTQRFLDEEWRRQQTDMGRDPTVVLGASPPWSGYNCVAMTAVAATSNVATGATATVTASCPYATLAVGGSFGLGSTNLAISKDAMSGNGWQVVAKNKGGATDWLSSYAYCLIGAPSGASVASIQGNVTNVTANSSGSSSATCSSGKLVSGGYTTTLGSNPTNVMRIYNNARTTSTGSTWQVSAQNATSSSKSITSFAYCLQGTNLTVAQKTSSGVDSSGIAGIACSFPAETLASGGWVFPRTTAYTVQSTSVSHNNAYFIQLVPPPANGDANAKAFVECISHP
jgi:hypothetical protein